MFKSIKHLIKRLNNYLDKQEEKHIIVIKANMLPQSKIPKNLTIFCQFDDNEELRHLIIYSEKFTRKQHKEMHEAINKFK